MKGTRSPPPRGGLFVFAPHHCNDPASEYLQSDKLRPLFGVETSLDLLSGLRD